MPSRQRLLLLQLPRLDPDVTTPGENVMLAAACLHSALARSPEGKYWAALPTPATQDTADNAGILADVLALRPDVIGATLYLWNVERTLRLLSMIKRRLPHVRMVVGGPEVARGHPLIFSYVPTVAADAGLGRHPACGGSGGPVLPGPTRRPRPQNPPCLCDSVVETTDHTISDRALGRWRAGGVSNGRFWQRRRRRRSQRGWPTPVHRRTPLPRLPDPRRRPCG